MTFVPHWRVSMIGRLGGPTGGEMFSCNFSLGPVNGTGVDVLLAPDNGYWDDLAQDCTDWFGRTSTRIHPDAVLQMVKVARIGADGKYTASPVERVVSQAGGWSGPRPPYQSAMKVTLGTDADLGRVKGGWYIPLPAVEIGSDGRVSEDDAENIEASTKTLLESVNNAPGIDVLDIGVVVASQGRRNKDGSVRVAPGNHVVKRVKVGRVLDTQRRRRNKLVEAGDFTTIADPGSF